MRDTTQEMSGSRFFIHERIGNSEPVLEQLYPVVDDGLVLKDSEATDILSDRLKVEVWKVFSRPQPDQLIVPSDDSTYPDARLEFKRGESRPDGFMPWGSLNNPELLLHYLEGLVCVKSLDAVLAYGKIQRDPQVFNAKVIYSQPPAELALN